MNKADIIKAVAAREDIRREDAERCIEAFLDEITQTLSRGEEVSLVGFGIFSVKVRAAHDVVDISDPAGRISLPETKAPSFRPGKNLKEAVK